MSKTPPYITFANQLQKDITNGKYGTEGGLPGVDELSETSGLSRATVYKSLTELQHRNVIVSRNRTFFVNPVSTIMSQHVPPLHLRMQVEGKVSFAENIISVEVIPLPDEIADKLGLERGKTVTHRYRVLGEVIDEKRIPSRLVHYYYLIHITEDLRERVQSDPTIHILLEVGPERLQRLNVISSRFPTKEEADLLKVSETTPVTHQQCTVRDMEGEIILFQDLVLLGVPLIFSETFRNRPQ